MATPWLVVPQAYGALAGSGVFASFSPTIEQVMKTASALRTHPFIEVETVELILRQMTVADDKTRPQTLMIGHSGYITTARKVLEQDPGWSSKEEIEPLGSSSLGF
jgi:tRNA (adenine57-N1/adenine58-N1)-methyltransferase